jgi:hypothetical protein
MLAEHELDRQPVELLHGGVEFLDRIAIGDKNCRAFADEPFRDGNPAPEPAEAGHRDTRVREVIPDFAHPRIQTELPSIR